MYGLCLGEMRTPFITRFIMNEQFGNRECGASAGAAAQRLFGVRMGGGMNPAHRIVFPPVRCSEWTLAVINEQLNLTLDEIVRRCQARGRHVATWFWGFPARQDLTIQKRALTAKAPRGHRARQRRMAEQWVAWHHSAFVAVASWSPMTITVGTNTGASFPGAVNRSVVPVLADMNRRRGVPDPGPPPLRRPRTRDEPPVGVVTLPSRPGNPMVSQKCDAPGQARRIGLAQLVSKSG
jgi:hypothetical protein